MSADEGSRGSGSAPRSRKKTQAAIPAPRASSARPSLRLIAGDLVANLARDAETIADIALGPDRPRLRTASASAASRDAEEVAPPRNVNRIAIVGGGIAGLAAAWSLLKDRGFDGDVVIYETSGEIGGKLKINEIEGMAVDAGAESMLAVRPEALSLAKAVGLGSSIVNPATSQASVLSRGHLRPLPTGLITGIPTDLRTLAASDILSVPGLLRIPLDYVLPQTTIDSDVSIGDYVATRLGREVVDRLVEPMLGGVYAGRSEELSLEMAVPALFRLAKREKSLLSAAHEARRTGAAGSGAARRGPVFAGIKGGVGRLPIALADRLEKRGAIIETGATVTGLRRTSEGWRLLVHQADETQRVDFDAVVLAVPAPAAAKLLRQANPHAAQTLDTIDYASVAVTTFLYDPTEVPASLQGSGFLSPPIEGFETKAATYSSRKWAWVARAGAAGTRSKSRAKPRTDGRSFFVVRTSIGRYGEPAVLQREDSELARLAALELTAIAGLPPTPLVSHVQRWGGALPQYTVGHRSRVARIREVLIDTPGLAVCGAAYDGVGIAACIGSAQFAAGQLAGYLAERGQWAHA